MTQKITLDPLKKAPRSKNPAPAIPRPVMHGFELHLVLEGMTNKFFGHAIDYGMGGGSHPAIGQWLFHGQDVLSARSLIEFSGLPMPKVVKTGRRKIDDAIKVARDVAVFLAVKWFEGLPGPKKIRNEVVDLWDKSGHKGITNESHVSTAIKRAKSAIPSLKYGCLIRFSGDDATAVGKSMVFVESGGRVDFVPGEIGKSVAVVVQGCGWYWMHGEEKAVYGPITGGPVDRITDETKVYPSPKKFDSEQRS